VSVFRRRRRADEPTETTPAEGAEDGATGAEGLDDPPEDAAGDDAAGDVTTGDGGTGDDAGSSARPATPSAGRESGPWDVTEVDDPAAGGRVDLGGMWLPGRPGLEVRVEADQATSQVVAVTLVLGRSALQLQPFAAPKTEDIWDEVRAEIRAGITKKGGTADEVEGPLGTELRTKVPVRAADGSSGVQPARFVGVSGPRWFLRGVLTGQAAVEEGTDADLVELFRDVVVVRGLDPMAPRDPIPLRLPAAPEAADAEGDDVEGGDDEGDADATRADDLNPFQRGPEITEIR
jgi:hypothetical protein